MKVRILSGNNAGQVTDLDGAELESNLSTGFVGPVGEEDAPPAAAVTEPPTAAEDVAADTQAAADNTPQE